MDIEKLIRHLEIIKNCILLEEVDILNIIVPKLEKYVLVYDKLQNVISAINNRNYANAIQHINMFLKNYKTITVWVDEDLQALKIELKILENQHNEYVNKKNDIEKLISDYQYKYNEEVSNIVTEILRLRTILFKDTDKYEEAQQDEEDFKQEIKEHQGREYFKLNEDEQKELKIKFRKASKLCHPDSVTNGMKEQAQKMFIELKKSYDNNNLIKVSEILEQLENSKFFHLKWEEISEKDKIQSAIQQIKLQIEILAKEIENIKASGVYQEIIFIDDWDIYFENLKKQLQQQLYNLQKEVANYNEE